MEGENLMEYCQSQSDGSPTAGRLDTYIYKEQGGVVSPRREGINQPQKPLAKGLGGRHLHEFFSFSSKKNCKTFGAIKNMPTFAAVSRILLLKTMHRGFLK